MEEFLQIEGVVWDDIKNKEPNVEFEFISANESMSMSTDSKPTLPDGSELPLKILLGSLSNSHNNIGKPNKQSLINSPN